MDSTAFSLSFRKILVSKRKTRKGLYVRCLPAFPIPDQVSCDESDHDREAVDERHAELVGEGRGDHDRRHQTRAQQTAERVQHHSERQRWSVVASAEKKRGVTKIISQANIAPKIAGDIIKPNAIAGQNAVRLVASAMPIVDSD